MSPSCVFCVFQLKLQSNNVHAAEATKPAFLITHSSTKARASSIHFLASFLKDVLESPFLGKKNQNNQNQKTLSNDSIQSSVCNNGCFF